MTSPDLELGLHPQQGLAVFTPATEVLYGGAAGGGKSHLMRVAAIKWCLEIPGIQGSLFRRMYPELFANHMEGPTSFPELLAPLVKCGFCRIVNNQIRFANRSKIHLRHCQHEKDLQQYQGAEFHFLLIDELTHWTSTMYAYLRGRCRISGLPIPRQYAGQFPRILAGSNPGSIGHHWVKEAFRPDRPLTLRRVAKKQGGMIRQFIPAKMADNPSLLESDPGYVDRLEGLGDALLIRALKDGDWDVVAGSMFGESWRRVRDGKPWHVRPPFPIPIGWELWRGADDGFAAPAACYWFTRDPDAGTVYVIRELYKAGMLPDEYAKRTLAGDREIVMIGPDGERVKNAEPLAGLMDSGAFSDAGHGSAAQAVPSRGKQMNAAGAGWKPVEKPPGSRVQRVQNLHRLLAINVADPHRRPGIVFFDTCEAAIRTIPTLPRDKNNLEDVDTDAEDHAFDGVTYGLQWKRKISSKIRVTGF